MLLTTHRLSIAFVNGQAQQLLMTDGIISWCTSKKEYVDKVYFDSIRVSGDLEKFSNTNSHTTVYNTI